MRNKAHIELLIKKPKVAVLWDFTTPECVSYVEAQTRLKHLTHLSNAGNNIAVMTNDLSLFNMDYNCVVIKQDGTRLSAIDLLNGTHGQTRKEIRPEHNISKMLRSGVFSEFQL